MTWIRWECDSPSHEVVGTLAQVLGVSEAQALGHYVAVCCGFGQYRADGNVAGVSDVTIERWALWMGKRGRFAEAFHEHCVESSGPRKGDLRGWWRQHALLDKQTKDASRPGQGTRKARERPPGENGVLLGGNGNGNVNGNIQTSPKFDLAPYFDAWERQYHGKPHAGQLGRFLKPVDSELGSEEGVARWVRYLAATPAQYASPARFAATHGSYASDPVSEIDALIEREKAKGCA